MLNRKYSMLNLFVICVEIESEWVVVGWRTIIIGQDWFKSKFGVFRCNTTTTAEEKEIMRPLSKVSSELL